MNDSFFFSRNITYNDLTTEKTLFYFILLYILTYTSDPSEPFIFFLSLSLLVVFLLCYRRDGVQQPCFLSVVV
jgi:hypothetical protein